MSPVEVICLMTIGVMVGTMVHEAGHFVVAALLGLHPRLVKLGKGPSLVRFSLGKTRFHLMLVPLGGQVMLLPRFRRRRLAFAAFALGGVLGNAGLFAVIAAISSVDQPLSRWLAPVGLVQLILIVVSLLPFRLRRMGDIRASDGLLLVQYLFGSFVGDLPTAQKVMIYSRLSSNVPIPPVSAATADIIYQSSRKDRLTEHWARRDATAAMRKILAKGQAGRAERAVVLDFLCENEILHGDTGVSATELDAWSREAVTLFDVPSLRVSRGTVLAVLGRAAEARAMLLSALDSELDQYNTAFGRLALASVTRALGDRETAQSLAEQAWLAVPKSDLLLRSMARVEHLLGCNGPSWRLEPEGDGAAQTSLAA